jgi:uncharacterized repeat protein (TIGR03803 family)
MPLSMEVLYALSFASLTVAIVPVRLVSTTRLARAGLLLGALALLFSPTALFAQGTYTETTLYSFCPQPEQSCPDGDQPQLATPVFDSQGNLYGTTQYGGANNTDNGCGNNGCGTVFKLTPNGNGTWTESVLYSFCSVDLCADGSQPRAGLIIDSLGNLYGTTYFGGNSNNAGTVFELSPQETDGRTACCIAFARAMAVPTGRTLLPLSSWTRMAISTALPRGAEPRTSPASG